MELEERVFGKLGLKMNRSNNNTANVNKNLNLSVVVVVDCLQLKRSER